VNEVNLKIPPRIGFNDNRFAYLKKCSQFVENKYAVLIHRPISVEYRKDYLNGRTYLSIVYACGNGANGADKFTLLDSVPEGRVVCARCEEAAIASGLPSSSELSDRHVCIGGVKAVSFCCGDKSNA